MDQKTETLLDDFSLLFLSEVGHNHRTFVSLRSCANAYGYRGSTVCV